ncbi:drebrin-like a [Scleropages formosus]|uniref:Drebrin like n=1 Tax=Scleropages formosus TaxID=113540 RepID=A0A8C9VRX2_SCLFO|nr:drebrin-like protein B [Scleropages formosus]
MAVNLSKNGPELTAAYREVVDEKSGTNWVLFTYEGNTNDIRLAEKGEGGLEELVEELNSGKVMYGFCRVKDPNSGLPKYVLINWTGEGVKDARKGQCANHVSTIANFLKGAHVTVNARAEEDVEPESIMQKVAKASGANYSFHKESSRFRDTGPQGPVGSVYQKTNAMSEIKKTNKDNFWAQTEKDEEKRQEEERRKAELERQRLDQERKAREAKEAQERECRDKKRAIQIEQQKKFQQQQEVESRDQQRNQLEEQEKEFQASQKKGFNRGESVAKASEAASVISQRSMNPRDLFQQRERDATPDSTAVSSQPGRLRSPFLSKQLSDSEPSGLPLHQASPLCQASPEPAPLISCVTPPEPCMEEPPRNQAEAVPVECWKETPPEFPAQEGVPQEEEDLYESMPEDAVYEEPPQAASVEDNATDQGICARALYDYQAADDTEISFDPDEIITGIEMIDEGWWRGYAPDGSFGMFPANYVDLL